MTCTLEAGPYAFGIDTFKAVTKSDPPDGLKDRDLYFHAEANLARSLKADYDFDKWRVMWTQKSPCNGCAGDKHRSGFTSDGGKKLTVLDKLQSLGVEYICYADQYMYKSAPQTAVFGSHWKQRILQVT